MNGKRLSGLLALCLLLGLTACGGGGESSSPGDGSEPPSVSTLAPAEEPEGVTVTDASGYYRMTYCPGNPVYYYMDVYWNFWFQGTGEAELYPLLLDQTA